MMHPSRPSRSQFLVAAAVFALFLMPSVAMAHAELEVARPRDGSTVEGTPDEVAGRYSEAMDADGSSLTLVGPDDAEIAKGGVDPANDSRMVITDIPELAPGTYTVKSTTKSAEDGDVDRTEWTFTVEVAPTPSPSPSPTATATPEPTPECTDGCDGQSSGAPTTAPPPTATPSLTPAPSPSADGGTAGSGGDVLLPIIAAVVLVGAVAGYLFSRRDRTPTQP